MGSARPATVATRPGSSPQAKSENTSSEMSAIPVSAHSSPSASSSPSWR